MSGPEDVDEVLKQITLGSLTDVEYVSCYICDGGCVGGPSVAVNKFVGTKNLERRAMLRHEREREDRREAMQAARICENFPRSKDFIKSLQAKPAPPLDPDFGTAMEKMERLTALAERLPGLDCGACGAPTCRIFAEVQSIKSQKEQLAQGRVPDGLSPQLLQQAQQNANMEAVNQLHGAMQG